MIQLFNMLSIGIITKLKLIYFIKLLNILGGSKVLDGFKKSLK